MAYKSQNYSQNSLLAKRNSLPLAGFGAATIAAWRRIEKSHWNAVLILTFKDWPSENMLVLAATPNLLREEIWLDLAIPALNKRRRKHNEPELILKVGFSWCWG
jgi:hypothetical protein